MRKVYAWFENTPTRKNLACDTIGRKTYGHDNNPKRHDDNRDDRISIC